MALSFLGLLSAIFAWGKALILLLFPTGVSQIKCLISSGLATIGAGLCLVSIDISAKKIDEINKG